MPVPWDQLLVYLIVAAAALYLARAYSGRRKSGCGGCESGCAAPAESPHRTEEPELIQLEIPSRHPDRG
jgi:hypothetical protein